MTASSGQPGVPTDRAASSGRSRVQTDRAAGDVLGNYELLEEVGAGAMGSVFRARQISMNRIVALKILPEEFAAVEGFVERFVREARSAGRCDHPNLIKVYDVGSSGGVYYFSMEFVGGPTLGEVLAEEGPLSEAEAVGQMLKITGALGEAHSHGIVHRDVKPENIILTEEGEPRLADLGLARPFGPGAEETNTSRPLGTPYYMSPEQVRNEKLDGRADLYALGAAFFHLLTGETLFSGPTPAAVMARHSTEAPRPLRRLRPDASRGLEAVVMKLLEKNPDDRYPDAEALIEDLEALSAGRSPRHAKPTFETSRYRPAVRARPSSRAKPLRRGEAPAPSGRSPARQAKGAGFWLAAGVVPTALLVIALALFMGGAEGPEPPPPRPYVQTPEGPGRTWKVPATSKPPGSTDQERPGPSGLPDLFARAESFAREHGDDYEAAIRRFAEVGLAGRGGPFEGKAKARIDALRAAWRRAALAALGGAARDARAKTGSADYDGALARLKAIPEGLAAQVEGEIEREAGRIRRAGRAKIDEILAAVETHLEGGNPVVARRVLRALSGVRYEEGRRAAAERASRSRGRIDAFEKEKQDAAEESARERLAELLPKFEAHVKAGLYADARRLVERSAAGVTGDVGETCRSASRVVGALEARRGEVRRALGVLADKGEDVSLVTTKGVRKGEIEAVTADGIELTEKITFGRQVVGQTRLVISWADLSPEQEERLAKGWKPRGPDGEMARAVLAICRKDPDTAAQALEAAGEHPLAAYFGERLEELKLGPLEAAARAAWLGIESRAEAKTLPAAAAKALLKAIAHFETRHGKTRFAASIADGIAAARARAERVIAAVLGPVGHWGFDEGGGGTAADSSGNGNGGTLRNMAGTEWTTGVTGGALRFDGVDDCVDCGNGPSLAPRDAVTVAAWVFHASGSGNGAIVGHGGGWADRGYCIWRFGGKIRVELQDTARGEKAILDNASPPSDSWHHVAFTWDTDTDTIKVYIDGVQAPNTRTFAGPMGAPTVNLCIGVIPGHEADAGGTYFRGLIDDVRVYNRALSEKDVQALATRAAPLRQGFGRPSPP